MVNDHAQELAVLVAINGQNWVKGRAQKLPVIVSIIGQNWVRAVLRN